MSNPYSAIMEGTRHRVEVNGCDVVYWRHGSRTRTPVVLVHGASAHAGWWHRVTPILAHFRDVAVVDLSGHGDSGHRSAYDVDTWAAEIMAVIENLDAGPALLVGHSMGGLIALHAAGSRHHHLSGVIAIDSAVVPRARPRRRATAVRHFVTAEDAMANFRLRPRETVADTAVLDTVAALGVRSTTAGWRFKFDPSALQPISRDLLYESIRKIACETAFIYGGRSSLVDQSTVDFVSSLVGRRIPSVVLDDCYHHVPLDAPARTAAAVLVLAGVLARPAVD